MCAPSRLNPFPGWKRPPTAKAMSVEKFLVTKYCREGGCGAGRQGRTASSAPSPWPRTHLAGGADVPVLRLLQLLETGLQQAAAALGHHCGEGTVSRRSVPAAGQRGGSYHGRARGRG